MSDDFVDQIVVVSTFFGRYLADQYHWGCLFVCIDARIKQSCPIASAHLCVRSTSIASRSVRQSTRVPFGSAALAPSLHKERCDSHFRSFRSYRHDRNPHRGWIVAAAMDDVTCLQLPLSPSVAVKGWYLKHIAEPTPLLFVPPTNNNLTSPKHKLNLTCQNFGGEPNDQTEDPD